MKRTALVLMVVVLAAALAGAQATEIRVLLANHPYGELRNPRV
jgi:hypothetical protein